MKTTGRIFLCFLLLLSAASCSLYPANATVAIETCKNQYVGAGTTGPFAYTFKIWTTTDLLVIKTDLSDVDTTLSLNTDYTVTGAGVSSGGTVTLLAVLPSGYKLTILRAMPLLQGQNWTGSVTPSSLNNLADKLEHQIQQVKEGADRAFHVPPSSTVAPGEIVFPLSVAYGGTGGATPAAARTNLGAEHLSDKDTTVTLGTSDTKYPSQKAVKTYVDNAFNAALLPGAWNNLKITTSATAIVYSCGAASLSDGSGNNIVGTGFTGTINMAANGAVDRLDTGAIAQATSYYVWLISNGTLFKAIASASATAPTMPSGYTYKLLVGAFKTQAGVAVFTPGIQKNRRFIFSEMQEVSSGSTVQAWVDTDCSSFIPTARVSRATFLSYGAGYNPTQVVQVRIKGSGGTGSLLIYANTSTGVSFFGAADCDLDVNRVVELNVARAVSWNLNITGYEVDI